MKIEKDDVIKILNEMMANSINIDSITVLERARDKIQKLNVPIDVNFWYDYTKSLTRLTEPNDIFVAMIGKLINEDILDKTDCLTIGKLYYDLKNNFYK